MVLAWEAGCEAGATQGKGGEESEQESEARRHGEVNVRCEGASERRVGGAAGEKHVKLELGFM